MSNKYLQLLAIIIIAIVVYRLFSWESAEDKPDNSDDTQPETVDTAWPPLPPTGEQVLVAGEVGAKNYYVIFDGSGSMEDAGCSNGESKFTAAVKALTKFAGSVPKSANLGLLAFDNNGISELLPLGIRNRDDFVRLIGKIEVGGRTPLQDALKMGMKHLEKQARSQLGYGEYNMVVVTDGEASDGQDPASIVRYTLDRSPVTIHTIGFCIGEHHSLNQPGKTVYKAANNPQELVRGLDDVLAEAEYFDVSEFKQ